ncbi:MAG TPA: DNA polymerase domain-containing protein [Bacteroidota bacterium]|nr:DNA polymerase domain-containing protein [Bacteroidota bacterium]
MQALLYGQNTEERIVAVQQKDDRTMRVYVREASGVRFDDHPFFPFFFLADEKLIEGFAPKHWVKPLEGNGYYRFLCAFEEWGTMWDAVRFVLERYNKLYNERKQSYNELEEIYLYADPVTQFLMQTGRTLFKGMRLEDVYRMQLDIETYAGSSHRFSNASRPTDRIILIALSDNRGWSHIIDGRNKSEKEMLVDLVELIRDKDPDVLEGHNIFNFDLPYILKRCELHRVAFSVGRDGSTPRAFETRASYADRTFEYTAAEIVGRHVIDTMLLVQSYDMTKRNMESYGLKYAASYFGLSSPKRTYIPGNRISWYWDHEPETLMAYALDDVTETRKLSEHLSGTIFYLTQMLPFAYGQVARMGSAAKIEALMVREYLRRKHSLPRPAVGVQTTGGYTDIFLTGVLGPVLHVDVESLYPSVMLNKHITPASDVLGVFGQLLSALTAARLDTKRRMQRTPDADERMRLDAMQSSLKILINSFYGYLGFARGLFNDFQQADAVTTTGQMLLREMIAFIESEGGKVIEVDTDGIFFVPPPHVRDRDSEEKFVESLSALMPQGINVVLDGRYRKMMSYKMKNYALLDDDGKLLIKGSSLISRSIERFGRRFIRECIECLLREDIEGLHRTYLRYRNDILDRKLDVREFARTETLKESLAEYERAIASGRRNRSAAYEVARASSRSFRPGDSVSYYITGTDPNVKTFEHCKSIVEWDPNFRDENTAYYLRRLDEFSEKFSQFFSPRDFRNIFSAEDLFPFTSVGIQITTRVIGSAQHAQHNRLDEPEEGGETM